MQIVIQGLSSGPVLTAPVTYLEVSYNSTILESHHNSLNVNFLVGQPEVYRFLCSVNDIFDVRILSQGSVDNYDAILTGYHTERYSEDTTLIETNWVFSNYPNIIATEPRRHHIKPPEQKLDWRRLGF